MKKIRFTSQIVFDGEFKYTESGYKSVATEKIKKYRNVLSRILRLPKAANDLMNYLIDFMDKENVVYSNGQFKDRFNRMIWLAYRDEYLDDGHTQEEAEKLANKHKYSDVTIRKAYSTLVKYNILIPYKTDKGQTKRGCYWVNPEFFWRESERLREEKIQKILQIEAGTEYSIVTAKRNEKE